MTERTRHGKRGGRGLRRRKPEELEAEAPPAPPERPPFPILNRELSHLEFQSRVLEEAQDERNPIVERARYLSIFHSNMDEFFMVRVAGLLKQVLGRVAGRSPDGLTPAEQLVAVRRRIPVRDRAVAGRNRISPGRLDVLRGTGESPQQQRERDERQRLDAPLLGLFPVHVARLLGRSDIARGGRAVASARSAARRAALPRRPPSAGRGARGRAGRSGCGPRTR